MTLCGREEPQLLFALQQVCALQSLHYQLKLSQQVQHRLNSVFLFPPTALRFSVGKWIPRYSSPCNLLLFGEHSSFRLPLGHNTSLHKPCPPHPLSKILQLQGFFWGLISVLAEQMSSWSLVPENRLSSCNYHTHTDAAKLLPGNFSIAPHFSSLFLSHPPLKHILISLFQSFITLSKLMHSIKNCHTWVITCLSW